MQPFQISLFDDPLNGNDFEAISNGLTDSQVITPDDFGKALYNWAHENINQSIKTLCLFSGAGGLDIGFHDAGFDIVECVEIEAKFVKSLEANKQEGKYLQNTNIVCKDIREYVPNFNHPIDFIIGGPPCQSFSKAGIRAAGARGTEDSRGTLFEEYVRILEQLQPKGFLFENVSGILSSQGGEDMKRIVKAFEKVGYTLNYRLLDAADYGVPQNRERLIMVGVKNKKTFKIPAPTHGVDSANNRPYFSAGEALSKTQQDNEANKGLNGRFGHLLKDIPPGLNYSFYTEKMGHPNPVFAWRSKFSDFLYKADPELPIRTLKASGGQYTGPFHWESRPFNVHELKRLQTFPDDYIITGGKGVAAKQIGNSVPPQFARILAISVLDQIFNIELPFELQYLLDKQTLSFRKVKSLRTKHYRKKAENAISNLQQAKHKTVKSQIIKGRLDGLRVIEVPEDKCLYQIDLKVSENSWKFTQIQSNASKIAFEIKITPKGQEFLFNKVKSVKLISNEWDTTTFLFLWKTLEKVLIDNNIKADLVQLAGYYQYKPNMHVNLSFKDLDDQYEKDNSLWDFIQNLFNDENIGEIRPLETIASQYDESESTVFDILSALKDIGFEIRNHNTNPEIPEGHYLIPYSIPTLNNLSLQLKTTL